ncbi:hypothetical protein [Litoribrevibacter albus]|uniref:Uncharacterized protein n=1 Tax=Litoribrevibacter albus TaxID=1473156 RepID=A0AA37SA65_9GAMM|nr:hypothetical protein [Litoribrevibacter albus]GLQ30947.1 hypothetical protein GCM10007876_14260 [Litoribrevibacter albus]
MLKHQKCRPYIRRLHGNEEAHDLLTQIELGFYIQLLQEKELKKAYVLTQRGFPKHVIAVSSCKQALIDKALTSDPDSPENLKLWSQAIQRKLNTIEADKPSASLIDLNESCRKSS